MILKLTGNEFNDSQLTTVGKEAYIYQATINGYNLKMKIYDTAGQERFRSMSVQVIKNSDAVMLVYAVNNKQTFMALENWLSQLNDTVDISRKPIIIVGNKSDIENSQREVTYEEGKNYADSKGYKFFETSAKNGTNVKEAFEELFNQLFTVLEPEITGKKATDKKGAVLNNAGSKQKRGKCC